MNVDQQPGALKDSDLIERWENADRVLNTMPEHVRQRHWNMAIWGLQAECGTVACAAGHCGLDPWFRERGFRLDFINGDASISNVADFFGVEGSSHIFMDSRKRSVETVLEEIRAHVQEVRRLAALNASAPCRIGEVWPGQGGVLVGARRGRDGSPDYFLIAGQESDADMTWTDAKEWTTHLDVEGHRDFDLPFRDEQRAQFDRVRHLFRRAWYWSGEQPASGSYGAWRQDFGYGYQNGWLKGSKLRARAVRRLPIQ